MVLEGSRKFDGVIWNLESKLRFDEVLVYFRRSEKVHKGLKGY